MSSSYEITEEVEGSYLGVSRSTDRRVLLVPTDGTSPPPNRAAGDLLLQFAKVDFALGERSFTSVAAVVECGNPDVVHTFEVLARDLAVSLQAAVRVPPPKKVSQLLAKWEQLLRSTHRLSRDEVIGLWGELWLLNELPDREYGILAWRGPSGETVDFVGGGIGVECKTSMKRLVHYVSQDQLVRPLGDLNVYLLSLWVGEDAIAGETIADLVERIDQGLSSRVQFEAKLLEAGYSRADAPHYGLRMRRLEPPLLIPIASVPRVREADPGVSHIRYEVALVEATAVSAALAMEAFGRLCSVE